MPEDAKDKIYSTFAAVASSLGYSEVHGRIIAALLVAGKPLSLDELCKMTKYSAGSISLSLDLLELVGIIKKLKNRGDRKLYVKIEGDLLDGLRKAFLLKLQKEINATLIEFDRYKSDKKAKKTISILEREVKRLDEYVSKLAEVKLPKT
jgi:DNA-binding transcriptional regulator GbsR (MarR family)